MRTRIAWIVGLGCWLAFAWPAAAEDLSAMCDEVLDVKVGQWAEYRMTGAEANGPSRMRLAIVGTQQVAGKPAYWIEMQMAGGPGSMTTQVLAGGYPYRADQIHEMVVKMGGQPAMKMPPQSLAMMRSRMGVTPSMGAADSCRKAKVVGWESITVPAGEFRALHLQPADARAQVWAAQKIPFGMVKVVHAEGTLELTGHGWDAKSSISETPRSLPGMPPGMGMPGGG